MVCEIFVGASLPHEKPIYLFYLGLPWIGGDGRVGWLTGCVWTIACNPYIQVDLLKEESLSFI